MLPNPLRSPGANNRLLFIQPKPRRLPKPFHERIANIKDETQHKKTEDLDKLEQMQFNDLE